MNRLFEPLTLGDLELANRIVMAPVVRARADMDGCQPMIAALYYASRATAGLLVTEPVGAGPTFASPPGTPGFWTPGQIDSWRPIVETVHAVGGRIALELCYAGTSDASATVTNGRKQIVARLRAAARAASEIEFDGIEIGASAGHLAPCGRGDARVQDACDLFDVLHAVAEEISLSRVGIRVPPMLADDCEPTVVERLGSAFEALDIAYLHLARTDGRDHSTSRWLGRSTKVIGETNLLPDDAARTSLTTLDAASFALPFVSNPDLVHRARIGGPYNDLKHFGLLGGGREGYLDYLTLEDEEPADVGLA